ncbi:MAG: enoyl-CoA hydratase/isomerase family protein [Parvularculaceae bacterium]
MEREEAHADRITTHAFGAFRLDIQNDGVGVVEFSRPPVNAVSISVYRDLGNLVSFIEASDLVRAVVLTAHEGARAWCGGADLNDFVGIDAAGRKERYRFVNEQLPRLYRLDRPVIAAINGAAIGVGMIIAGLCDMRVAAEDAAFACPEIDYGLVGGAAGLFFMLKIPEAKSREMLFTGERFSARSLEATGFFNAVVPRADVMATAMKIARSAARKSLPVIRARKRASIAAAGDDWRAAYLIAQSMTAELSENDDGGEGVRAFLDRREPNYRDR